ncbi:MAG: D-alanyl-D-alanine carboxypeptidase [Clostridia bacterium]|nr:D-alanyl-D-alanine carboxypeptidase [Clostridia bacterium]
MKKSKLIASFFAFFIMILQFFNVKCSVFAGALAGGNEITDAKSFVTIEASTGRVLYEKDKNKKLPMASTTKIITAIVALENHKDLDKKYLITKEMTGVEGSSIYLKAGEHLSVRDLLYGLMLRSGNDSAVAIAIIVGGSVQRFVQMMNEFCLRVGAGDTHIVTVNGLHDDEHYSTAEDLAKITAYAYKNEEFKTIVGTKEKVISSDLDQIYKCRLLKNKNKLLKMVDGADGVKTGYTKKAGKCFVGSACRNGMRIICVALGAKTMFDDSAKFIEKAFKEYRMVKLFKSGEIVGGETKTQNGSIYLKNDIIYPLSSAEISKINAKAEIFDSPNKDGEIGALDFRIENDLLFSVKLFTIIIEKNGAENGFKSRLSKIIKSF